jgi:PIN domain nuclease of toxin-antitoxin system
MEIGQKYQKGKLSLPMPPSKWFHAIVKHHGLTVINVDADICLRATELPEIHKDPFDRLIISTALRLEREVVTADAVFSSYGVGILC